MCLEIALHWREPLTAYIVENYIFMYKYIFCVDYVGVANSIFIISILNVKETIIIMRWFFFFSSNNDLKYIIDFSIRFGLKIVWNTLSSLLSRPTVFKLNPFRTLFFTRDRKKKKKEKPCISQRNQ